jgi:hypothetical protein
VVCFEAGFPHRYRAIVLLCCGRCLLFLCGGSSPALLRGVCGGVCGLKFRNLCRVGLGKLRAGAGAVF